MNMTFDNPLFLIPVMTGVIFIITGWIMMKFPPKDINSLYGYRTKNSMKNKERWAFAQKYSAIEMTKLGGLLTLSGVMGFFFNPTVNTAVVIGLGSMLMVVIILFLRVENAIKKKFDTSN